MLDAYLRLFHK